jgi:hypothetical protein
MDELDMVLRGRLEALADAVPVRTRSAPVRARMAPVRAGRRRDHARAWYRYAPELALVALLLLTVSGVGLLFMGGSIEGRLGPVGPLPGIRASVPGDGDVPCSEDGEGVHCASPVPTIDPAVAPDGVALSVPSVIVQVDHLGAYSIPLGTAVLPNGVLTEAAMTVVDPDRTDLKLRDGDVRLLVLGEDGRRFGNTYTNGWHPGTEEVTVSLEFTVTKLDGPTTLDLMDIVVR